MSMKFSQNTYGSSKGILTFPDHYVAYGQKFSKDDALAVTVDGRKIVKAGTVYPANDSSAVGVVLNDLDVTDGDEMGAVILHGFVKTSALPIVPTQEAMGALKGITFMGALSYVPVSVRKYSEASHTETIGGSDYVINTTGVQPTLIISDAEDVDYEINLSGIAPEFPIGYAAAAGFTGGETNNAVVLIEIPFDGSEVFDATHVKYNGNAVTDADVKYIDGTWYLIMVKGLKVAGSVISGGFATFTLAYGDGDAKTYKWTYNGLTLAE